MIHSLTERTKKAFTLIEVVLAVGILSLAILSLLMMFGPTMKTVNETIAANEASAVIGAFDTFLQNSVSEDADPTGVFEGTIPDWIDAQTPFYVYGVEYSKYSKEYSKYGENEIIVTLESNDIRQAITDGEKKVRLIGNVLRVQMDYLASGYDYSDIANQAYLPMVVRIYTVPDPYNNPSQGGAVVLTYTTAVLR